jgi:hypothetical protein
LVEIKALKLFQFLSLDVDEIWKAVSCVVATQTKKKRKGNEGGGATEKHLIHETRALCDFEISTILHIFLFRWFDFDR